MVRDSSFLYSSSRHKPRHPGGALKQGTLTTTKGPIAGVSTLLTAILCEKQPTYIMPLFTVAITIKNKCVAALIEFK